MRLEVTKHGVDGECALDLAPGTTAKVRDQKLDALLALPLTDAGIELDVVLAASPSAFAFQEPGKDSEGRTPFTIRGRIEGDRLVPSRQK